MARILLVEDDPLVSDTIALVLQKAGHDVEVAHDGNEGLAKFAAMAPDLVITDIVMPEKEGVQLIRELRAQSAVPIIAISGGGRTKNFHFLEIAKALGATEVLRKPFARDALFALIARCLHQES